MGESLENIFKNLCYLFLNYIKELYCHYVFYLMYFLVFIGYKYNI